MKFAEFKKRYGHTPLITSREVVRTAEDPQAMRNQLNRWRQKGWIISLRRGVYTLSPEDRKQDIDIRMIANRLYEPSYISLEYALQTYGLIPEAVADLTSVTTRKTQRFDNPAGRFTYQHIQPRAFRGFHKTGQGINAFFMAEPEKAVADFIYLNLVRFKRDAREVLEGSYRFQNIEDLDTDKLHVFADLFGSKKLTRVVGQFIRWIEKERKA